MPKASPSSSATTVWQMEPIFSTNPPRDTSCSKRNLLSKLKSNWNKTWLKSKMKNANWTRHSTLNCGTLSSKRLNWRPVRKPPEKVLPKLSKNERGSNLTQKTSWTSYARTWPVKSRKWPSAWTLPSRSRRKSLDSRKPVTQNTTSKGPCSSSKSSIWLKRPSNKMKKKSNLFRSLKSKKLKQWLITTRQRVNSN